MLRRRILLSLLLSLSFTAAVSADNLWSYSLGLAGTDYFWVDDSGVSVWQEQLLGGELRGSAVIKPTGLYFANFVNVSVPTYLYHQDLVTGTITTYYSGHDLYSSLGLTFGYRTDLRRLGAFFVGVGPTATAIADFDSHVWLSGGISVEFGLEFIKRKGIGFGFTSRATMPLAAMLIDLEEFDAAGAGYYSAPEPTSITIVFGISWASVRN